jgi:hypothetical protein
MFHAEIEATSRCTTRCLHCPHEALGRPAGRMSWECYVAVVEQIRAHVRGERFSLSFSGMGEATLNPLIFDFIRHVSADAKTSFATSGAALTEGNIGRLIDAGLDTIYVSFNGDEPEVFARMSGGLSFTKTLADLRRAIARTRGTRLSIAANVSITKANRDRVTRLKHLLETEGVPTISFSLCHSRGGNLQDTSVCDTPPMGVERWACDVMQNTLFVDWRGRAHICDHDLHDEYELGDLTTESLAVVLTRRQRIIDDGCALEICRQCNDVMKIGGTFPLESHAGGIFRDWIYYLYQDLPDPLSEANEPMKWIFRIYEKEGRTDRFANRLLRLEREAQRELAAKRTEVADLTGECDLLRVECASLQRMLDERDRDFAHLHAEYVAIRNSLTWRLVRMLANDINRITRWLSGLRR